MKIKDYDLLVIGETLIEFKTSGDIASAREYDKDIGGADIYTATTASRLGSAVAFASAIGRDPFYSLARERLLAQGINIDSLISCEGYNGIYFTSSKYPDEREYLYHSNGEASKNIKPSLVYDSLLSNSKIIYASSELQSVSKSARHTIFKAFHYANINNAMVAYDPNLRLHRWSVDDAKEALWGVLPLIDVIFPSAPDETKVLLGYERPLDVIGFLWDRGVSIVVVKTGKNGCMVGYDGKVEEFNSPVSNDLVQHMTLIGSAFNGGFLHCIAQGLDPFSAAEFANSVAAFKGTKGDGIESLPTEKDIAS